jgi:hypothetical protein
MPLIETQTLEISCPYCGEMIEILVDPSEEHQSYIEDCSVCCRPMKMHVSMDEEGRAQVQANAEDEV